MFIQMLKDSIADALVDSLKILPVLFLAYLLMEFLEHRMSDKTDAAIMKAGKAGPFIGALLGIIPQCGFSGAAASLYAGRVITLGTLLAVFLATSDEMLPILLASDISAALILTILLFKLLAGMAVGFAVDFFIEIKRKKHDPINIHDVCQREHCSCKNGIVRSAIKHTIRVILLIFVITVALNLILSYVGDDWSGSAIWNIPLLGEAICALVGLIPNCASSVIITNLFLEGAITFGAMMAGLLVNSGVGLLILFRMNKGVGRNISITAMLYVIGVLVGYLANFII